MVTRKTDLKKKQDDALELQKAIEYDDEGATHFSSVDDEYKYGGVEDPKVSTDL